MKSVLRKIVLKMLVSLAGIKLKNMHATIIGVTGSVGKTTCKDAIYDVLSKRYKVLKNKKSFNSEFGLPLTILQQDSGFSSPAEWLKILVKGLYRAIFVNDKYDFLVLEMGVDKPGDMDFLTGLVKPDIAVLTAIKPAHLDNAQFKNTDEIFSEKKKIFKGCKMALINLDDKYVSALKPDNAVYYGSIEKADYRVSNFKQTAEGIEFNVDFKNESYPFFAPLYGEYQAITLMPAIIMGLKNNVDVNSIREAVSGFSLPPGRLNLIEGIDDTIILDSTYNASPEAVKEALKVLDFFGKEKNARRVFVFGNMNELGDYSKALHEEVGAEIPRYADLLLTVGGDVRYAASAANKNGLDSAKIMSFDSAEEAVKYYKNVMENGDIILAKGSQNNVRLEVFVKAFMKHPEKAGELLVRQEESWQNIRP